MKEVDSQTHMLLKIEVFWNIMLCPWVNSAFILKFQYSKKTH